MDEQSTLADLTTAAARYDAANRQTLEFVLARPALPGGLIDTKVNPLTGESYTAADGLRGPDWTYGWIQGRGLEALACFSRHYRASDPALADRLLARLTPLYHTIKAAVARDGSFAFLSDRNFRAFRPEGSGQLVPGGPGPSTSPEAKAVPQYREPGLYSYTDIFAAKGLIAAATLIDPAALPGHLAYLADIRSAITGGRFQMTERADITAANIAAEPDDFGPRMIMLGAAGMLAEMGLPDEAAWADAWITDVLDGWLEPGTDLLRNVPGEDALNAGHGIEFIGFAFYHLGQRARGPLANRLAAILLDLAGRSIRGPGIPVQISIASGAALTPNFPWWPLPETIRAAALARAAGADPQAALARLQAEADQLFFSGYWREGRGYAYQTLTLDGPINHSPGTPDLDPGYHTGLSLLAASTS